MLSARELSDSTTRKLEDFTWDTPAWRVVEEPVEGSAMESRRLRCKVSIKERANAGIPSDKLRNPRREAVFQIVRKRFRQTVKSDKARPGAKRDDGRHECDA